MRHPGLFDVYVTSHCRSDDRSDNGNDVLVGGTGNDTLKGISGQNILIGGAGGDLLRGGTG